MFILSTSYVTDSLMAFLAGPSRKGDSSNEVVTYRYALRRLIVRYANGDSHLLSPQAMTV